MKYVYKLGGGELEVTDFEKDVGVMISDSLKPSMQCAKAAKKANQVLGQIARAISFRDKFSFTKLCKVYVRPHLQCNTVVQPGLLTLLQTRRYWKVCNAGQ